ncbi:MAG TPA: FAD-dependent monooxygenase [Bryobacteraceae bacterium]|nr:FAD-dependent monooxygenase [Bryobacteraceae bacterium]
MRWDVAVVGGGPAGLAAAIAARRKDLSVAVFEGISTPGPIDKCCGEGLMPDAIDALRSLGIVLPPSAAAPLAGIRFLDGGCCAEARFPEQKGAGVRRTVLHALLEEKARDLGVVLFRNHPVRDLASVQTRWIVAADGAQSALRRVAGLEPERACPQRFGTRLHFRVEPWADLVEVYWTRGAQAYVTPVAGGQIDVAIVSREARRFHEMLPLFPILREKLSRAEASSAVRGGVTASRTLPRVTRGNFALIGDASGSVDAVTGLGLSLAFQQAKALADALGDGDLSRYAAAHRRISRIPRVMEALMLTMDRHDRFRRRAIRALDAEQGHFSCLLAVHNGASLGLGSGLRIPLALGWRFLTV